MNPWHTGHLPENVFYNFCYVMADTQYSLIIISTLKMSYACVDSPFFALRISLFKYFHRRSIYKVVYKLVRMKLQIKAKLITLVRPKNYQGNEPRDSN